MVCNDVNNKVHYGFKDEKSQYRSETTVLVRDFELRDVVDPMVECTKTEDKLLKWRFVREAKETRALCVPWIRYNFDFTYKQISELTGGLILTRISELNEIGLELIEKDER